MRWTHKLSKLFSSAWGAVLLLAVVGCGGETPRVAPEAPQGSEPAESVAPDDPDAGGVPVIDVGDDGGTAHDDVDGGAAADAGSVDASPIDAGPIDAGPIDAGSVDAGPVDAGPVDAGPVDAGPVDAGPVDPGPVDAGPVDPGPIDAGSIDAGPVDAGPVDPGPIDAGPIDAGPVDPGPVDAGLLDAGAPHADAGAPARSSCLEHLHAGAVDDGPYPIDPDGDGQAAVVYCDMTTDDGGWTLVAATRGASLNDERAGYYEDLARADPTSAQRGVWDGLRALVPDRSDVRFTCKVDGAAAAAAYDVDLSFYDVGWYREITTGSDADACFEEGNGAGYTGPWARRNNLTGERKGADDDYDHDYQGFPPHMEGEDSCADEGDFVVDFDDRGMDSIVFDGTDWGEDDHGRKCGSVSPVDGSWQLWVRE